MSPLTSHKEEEALTPIFDPRLHLRHNAILASTLCTAKHRVAKDFVCPVCSKGFARKDILKRHQQGHEKQAAAAHEAALRGDLLDRDYDSSASTGTVKSKKKRVQSAAEVPVEDNGPVKIARVGRACCRCSKSKYVNVTLSTSLDSIANKARPPRAPADSAAMASTRASGAAKPASNAALSVRASRRVAPVPSTAWTTGWDS